MVDGLERFVNFSVNGHGDLAMADRRRLRNMYVYPTGVAAIFGFKVALIGIAVLAVVKVGEAAYARIRP